MYQVRTPISDSQRVGSIHVDVFLNLILISNIIQLALPFLFLFQINATMLSKTATLQGANATGSNIAAAILELVALLLGIIPP